MKFIEKNKLTLESESFFRFCCFFIILLSIYFRSKHDIGPDSGVYLNLAERIANGQKYYFNFFESNFPISFYFYSLLYKISQLLSINIIIFSEFAINFLAILSILWSSKILQKTTLYNNKSHYHLLIILFCLCFFLRVPGIKIFEFGTKTSLALILIYPYLSYSLKLKNDLNNFNKITKGVLMGVLPCIKPHYAFFIAFIEIFKLINTKKLSDKIKFLFDHDKKAALAIIAIYLLLMIKFTPEFFKFMVPMWSEFYTPYSDKKYFLKNSLHIISNSFVITYFVIIAKTKLKKDYNDNIFIAFLIGTIFVAITENTYTIDQSSIYIFSISIIIYKIFFDAISQKILKIKYSLIYLLPPIIILSFLQNNSFGGLIYGQYGALNLIWIYLIWQIYQSKNINPNAKLKIILIIIFLFSSILALNFIDDKLYVVLNSLAIFILFFFYEKRINPTKKLSAGSSIIFIFTVIYFISLYTTVNLKSFFMPAPHQNYYDLIAYYYKKNSDDNFKLSVFANLAYPKFPISNYLKINSDTKFYVNTKPMSFDIKNSDRSFVKNYLENDAIKMIEDRNNKIAIFKNNEINYKYSRKCDISYLESYLKNSKFRKIFIKNYRYDNTISFKLNDGKQDIEFDFYVRKNF